MERPRKQRRIDGERLETARNDATAREAPDNDDEVVAHCPQRELTERNVISLVVRNTVTEEGIPGAVVKLARAGADSDAKPRKETAGRGGFVEVTDVEEGAYEVRAQHNDYYSAGPFSVTVFAGSRRKNIYLTPMLRIRATEDRYDLTQDEVPVFVIHAPGLRRFAVDVQLAVEDKAKLAGGPGLRNAWCRGGDDPALLSSFEAREVRVLDDEGQVSYRVPRRWCAALAGAKTQMTIWYRAVAYANGFTTQFSTGLDDGGFAQELILDARRRLTVVLYDDNEEDRDKDEEEEEEEEAEGYLTGARFAKQVRSESPQATFVHEANSYDACMAFLDEIHADHGRIERVIVATHCRQGQIYFGDAKQDVVSPRVDGAFVGPAAFATRLADVMQPGGTLLLLGCFICCTPDNPMPGEDDEDDEDDEGIGKEEAACDGLAMISLIARTAGIYVVGTEGKSLFQKTVTDSNATIWCANPQGELFPEMVRGNAFSLDPRRGGGAH